ncbi:MAG: hypothetical protein B6242_15430 [Anaerolineaceae bacterium 4572_78]|nr:MAG: hypothetical protein B6242_15430 [Anaerolineaceae bacterium 4572_78]
MTFKNETEFRQWNESMAEKYDPEAYHERSHFIIRWIAQQRVRSILQLLNMKPNDMVLEVGCGTGNVIEKIPSHFLYGIDLSTLLLKKAMYRFADNSISLAQGNAEKLPFTGQSFDKIVCTEVIEHVINPKQILHEIARLAMPHAVIVVTIPNEKLIIQVKQVLRNIGLFDWLLKGNGDSYNAHDDTINEWHLHNFDLNLLKEITPTTLQIQQIRAIPWGGLPLQYVVGFQRRLEKG